MVAVALWILAGSKKSKGEGFEQYRGPEDEGTHLGNIEHPDAECLIV